MKREMANILIQTMKKIWHFYNEKINLYKVEGVLEPDKYGSLQEFGVDALLKSCRVLDEYKIPYSLGWGTVLGVYRENRLIPHDNDLDLDLFDCPDYELVVKALESIGMKLGMKVFYRKKIQQLVFLSKNNISLDVVFWVKKNNLAVTYCEPGYVLKLPIDLLKEKSYVNFFDYNIALPSSAESYLISVYGQNWKTPKISKSDWKEDCHIIHKRFDPFFWSFHYLYPLYCKYIKKI
ncbi:MAG: hypothetical protein A2493_01865 [Candidatus Magasanikbacteria bacterium RIFOXYC12_FULL_33_11]|uniref:LicD/FKTN/FKRP nucleotidyltransferase domain-containing protein n=1 Tax=Candidatus Magasanikbacteria bacterium RIFOXYC12_FULL_33_11 TaxID=1798701 RepID=A0A1F6NLS6_9BACT|nr:MAG: hypothetical protein A2493_01865 [Candidatus Magasanikbacteria bacterium RIFOXYC12_FULL_33_11]